MEDLPGPDHRPKLPPPVIGVTSAAAVAGGVVYVGGGDTYWYALDAVSGAVLWKVYTGDNSQAGRTTTGPAHCSTTVMPTSASPATATPPWSRASCCRST